MAKARVFTDAEQADLLAICKDRFVDCGTHLENRYQFSNRAKAGRRAGSTNPTGYRHVSINGVRHREHRLAWLMRTGAFPDDQLDHINGNPLDQSPENLRGVSNQENSLNQKRPRNNKSGITGVYWNKQRKKWHAQIKIGGKTLYLGLFADFFDACCARKAAERTHNFHPSHGRAAS